MTEINRAGEAGSLGHIDSTQKDFRSQIDALTDTVRQLGGKPTLPADPLSAPYVLYVDSYIGSDTFVSGDYNAATDDGSFDSKMKRISLQRLECGYTQSRPFRTISRAAIEAGIITSRDYLDLKPAPCGDLVTIVLSSGVHTLLNSPGDVTAVSEWTDGFNPTDTDLTAFSGSTGGVILPRGCSVVSLDLRKTIIRPSYVPPSEDEAADLSNRSSMFLLTGGCYLYGFTLMDKEGLLSSHHLLSGFGFAGKTELDSFYTKIRTAFDGTGATGNLNSAIAVTRTSEYFIVGPTPPTPTEPTDTTRSSSPYVYNISLRSEYGMSGMIADGSLADGSFKSIVVAQYTGVSLQRDLSCWEKYESGKWGAFSNYNDLISSDPNDVRYKPGKSHFHVRTRNGAIIQEVSVFAIGFATHHFAESGSQITITNSNSNFGGCAALADGFQLKAAPIDGPWKPQALKVARDPLSKDKNIRNVYLGATSSSNSSAIVLNDDLEPNESDPNQPEVLVRQKFTLKEDDYIWIENPIGPDYRAKLSATPWDPSSPNIIGISSGLTTDNADNNRPPGYIIPGVYPQPSPDHPALTNFRVYVRRVVDVRSVSERKVRVLVVGENSKRYPNRDYIIQPVSGTDWTDRIVAVTQAEVSNEINTVSQCLSLGTRYSHRPNSETNFNSGVYYRPADTVTKDNKHLSATQVNYGAFDPKDWEESYVHTQETYNPEGYYSNEHPILLFDGDTSETEASTNLGFSLSTPIIQAQIYSAVDYQGMYQLLLNLGQTSSQAHASLLPRDAANRLQDISGSGFTDLEVRRPSNIRLYSHAYEWSGFGSYTKALPQYQRTMTPYNKFTYYFTNEKGGKVYASGFNEEGLLVTPRGLEDLTTGEVLNFENISDNDFIQPEPEFPTEVEDLTINNLTVNNVNATDANITGQPCFTDGLTSSGDIFINQNCEAAAVDRGIRLGVDGTLDADLYLSGTSGVFTYADDNGTPFPLPGDGIGPWIKVPGSDVIGQNAVWIVTAAIAGGGGGPFSVACYCALSGADTRTITAMGPQPNHNGHGIVELKWSSTSSVDVAYLEIRIVGWDLLKVMQMKVNAQRLFGTGQDLLDPYPVSSTTRSGEPRLF